MAAAVRLPLQADPESEAMQCWRRSPVTKWNKCSARPDLDSGHRRSGEAGWNRKASHADGLRVPARFLGASLILHALVLFYAPSFSPAPGSHIPRLHARLVQATPLATTSAATLAEAPAKPARARAQPLDRLRKPESGERQRGSSIAFVASQTASVVAAGAAPESLKSTDAVTPSVAAAVAAVPSSVAPIPVLAAERATEGAALDAYARTLSAEITRQRRYPAVARMRGWQGTAVLAITLSPGGAVLKSALSRSSGYAVLDEQALKMVAEASPLPSAPPPLRGRALEFELPVVFTLAAS
jgi:periplasmic protein TonB